MVETDRFFMGAGLYFVHGGAVVTVYVDLLFAINTVINYLLLRGSAAIGGCPARFRRLLAAAAIGGVYAVAAVLPGLTCLQRPVFQLVSGMGMLAAAFGWKRNTVKLALFFFALSFAFGGAVLLLVQTIEPNCILLGGRVYYAVTTPALLFLAGVCYGLAALVLQGWGTHTGGDLVSLQLSLHGQEVKLRALRDTGNTLRDPMTGEAILVAGWRILSHLLPDAGLQQSEFADPPELTRRLSEQYPSLRFRLLTYTAVGVSHGLLPAVRCTVRQGKKTYTVPVAFTAAEISAHGQFEALTGGAII